MLQIDLIQSKFHSSTVALTLVLMEGCQGGFVTAVIARNFDTYGQRSVTGAGLEKQEIKSSLRDPFDLQGQRIQRSPRSS